ncbi:MAG: hypothetical protein HQM10_08910 [Candidatus Riflebacteria bacterium]|nr:hypothetical protein [Candidatus Riflebacteria bacterium]
MTREALSEYAWLMRSAGLILFHVSITIFNLGPLVHAEAKDLGLERRQFQNPASETVSKSPWTDNYSSLLSARPSYLSMFVVPTSLESAIIQL